MVKEIVLLIYINLIICFGYGQNAKLGIHVDPGDDIIRVINLTEKFSIESQIDPDEYILGPSDKLGLNIIGSENKTFILTITPTGELLIPQIGVMQISGKTVAQAKLDIDSFVKNNAFKNARVELVLLNIRNFKIQTIGAVNNPGFITVNSTDRLDDIISKAGGLHKFADEDSLIIKRNGNDEIFSLQLFNKTGILKENPTIKESDIVIIPYEKQFTNMIGGYITAKQTPVVVTGFVAKPGSHNYYAGYSVIEYIGFSGGVSDMGSLKRVEIYRNGDVFTPQITDVVMPGDHIHVPANMKYRFLGNVSILQTVTAIMSLMLTFQAATAD